MTENNAAQAAEHVETLQRMRADYNPSDGPMSALKAAALDAALSKLRAEGVQEGDERAEFEAAYEDEFAFVPIWLDHLNDGKGAYASSQQRNAYRMWQRRAALASAHVAGEATVYLDAGHLREVLAGNDMPVSASAEPGHGMVPLHAAPQASEAQCSCPSGDGSLRHPCAVHPASDAVRDAADVFGSPLTPYGLLARALRAATGTTLMQMARETGSTPAEISSYEFGRKAPDESWFERAAFFFASNGIVVSPTALRQAHERAALSEQPGAQKEQSDA